MGDLEKVAELAKNPSTKIVFSLTEYKGQNYVDLREYVESATYTGFTKKGIRLQAGKLDALIACLEKVRAALPEGGAAQESSEPA